MNVQIAQYKQKLWNRQFVTIILANIFLCLGYHVLPSTLPIFVTKVLGGKPTQAGYVIGVLTFSAVLIRPFAGRLTDTLGRKKVYFIGIILFLASVAAYDFAPTVIALLIVRCIHGFAWGLTTTASNTIASDSVPIPRMGEGMGYYAMTANLAMAIAPATGLALISGGDFTNLFIVSILFTLVAGGLGLSIPKPEVKKQPTQQKAALFERKALLGALITTFITMTYGSVVSFIPIYAQGVGVTSIGLYYTVFSISLLLVRAFTGRIGDKKGFTVIVVPGLLAMMAAMFTLSQATSLWLFILAAVLYGFGFGGVTPSLQAIAVRDVEPLRRGAANATFLNGIDLGIAVGSILSGVVAETTGYGMMFQLGIIPPLIALIIYLIFGRKQGNKAAVV